MDLSIDQALPRPAGGSFRPRRCANGNRNDAFSFWKLPESWRLGMDAIIADSVARARLYLFEEYLDDRHRRPSRILSYYYSV